MIFSGGTHGGTLSVLALVHRPGILPHHRQAVFDWPLPCGRVLMGRPLLGSRVKSGNATSSHNAGPLLVSLRSVGRSLAGERTRALFRIQNRISRLVGDNLGRSLLASD